MTARSAIKKALKRTPARFYYNLFKAWLSAKPQSNESKILARLVGDCPKTFVEFGFHPTEYNCIALKEFDGLLVDGDPETVRLAHALLPKRITARQMFISLDNIAGLQSHFKDLGVLSVDVDGNDYWFLKALLSARPHVVAVEYNASFGLRPITIPYDPTFDRGQKHDSGWYHGASLTALTALCRSEKYKLVAVSEAGGNAFFVRENAAAPELDPSTAYRESALRNRWSGTTAAQQWERIKHLPFVETAV